MSGVVEGVSLAVGLLSLVIQVSSSYGAAAQRLQSFRSYTEAVSRVRLRVGALEHVFRNDCRRLLRSVIDDEHEVGRMLKSLTHWRWADGDTEAQFRSFMGDKRPVVEGLLQHMRQLLQDFHQLLASSHVVHRISMEQGPSMVGGWRRLISYTFTFKETHYEKKLGELQQLGSDLSRLVTVLYDESSGGPVPSRNVTRQQWSPALSPRTDDTSFLRRAKSIAKLQQASTCLGAFFSDAWRCGNSEHDGHEAELFLSDVVGDHPSLYLALVTQHGSSNEQQQEEPPLLLDTILAEKQNPGLPPIDAYVLTDIGNSLMAYDAPASPAAKKCKSNAALSKSTEPKSPSASQSSKTLMPPPLSLPNLTQAKSICCELRKFVQSGDGGSSSSGGSSSGISAASQGGAEGVFTVAAPPTRIIAYIELPSTAARRMLIRAEPAQQPLQRCRAPFRCSLADAVAEYEPLTQLQLALRLARAVLQLHATAWLAADWSLRDLHFLRMRAANAAAPLNAAPVPETTSGCLSTLHVSMSLPHRAPADYAAPTSAPSSSSSYDRASGADTGADEGDSAVAAAASKLTVSTEDVFGVRNATLASLGIALIEVGLGKVLHAGQPREANDRANPSSSKSIKGKQRMEDESMANSVATLPEANMPRVVMARKILRHDGNSLRRALGARYLDVIRRCIDCDFAAGADLTSEELQTAVYRDVVCCLEELARKYADFLGVK